MSEEVATSASTPAQQGQGQPGQAQGQPRRRVVTKRRRSPAGATAEFKLPICHSFRDKGYCRKESVCPYLHLGQDCEPYAKQGKCPAADGGRSCVFKHREALHRNVRQLLTRANSLAAAAAERDPTPNDSNSAASTGGSTTGFDRFVPFFSQRQNVC